MSALGVTFGFIAVAAFVSNALFCFLMYKKPVLLKKPHNILLLTLATIDMATGIVIFITPMFGVIRVPIHDGPLGYFFCYIFQARVFVFFLSKASILAVTLLALERWFSVIKPFSYKVYFTRKKLFKYVACIFALSFLTQSFKFFETKFENLTCVEIPSRYGKVGQQAFVSSYVIITFVIPTFITWASFVHIWYRVKNSPSLYGLTDQTRAQQKLLLRMCAITAAVLTGCWLPSQTQFVLSLFDIVISPKVRVMTLLLSMSNSIVNPWIYFLSNKDYRKEFFSLFSVCKRNARLAPETGMPVSDTQMEEIQHAV